MSEYKQISVNQKSFFFKLKSGYIGVLRTPLKTNFYKGLIRGSSFFDKYRIQDFCSFQFGPNALNVEHTNFKN